MTRGELLERVTSGELTDWLAYDRAFGLGDNLEVIGTVCTVLARGLGGSKDATPASFVPYFKPQAPPTPAGGNRIAEQMRRIAARQNARHNARV